MAKQANRKRWHPLLWSISLLLLLTMARNAAAEAPWVLIDTATAKAQVMQGDQTLLTLDRLSVGRAGVTDLHIKGDDRTPRGEFRVTRIDPRSRFNLFIGIDYPTQQHVAQALAQGVIDQTTHDNILAQTKRLGTPPQNTVLGGHLGLHGLGAGDPKIHDQLNWTHGCVAFTNQQIEQLSRWIRVGSRIIVR